LLALFCVAACVQQKGTFTDPRDGKKYKTVKIGKQTWMAENLNYATEGSKCYDNEPENCKKFGRLYNWDEAMKACPVGWHLPSEKEWEILSDFVGINSGEKLKAKSGWQNNGNGTDKYNFSALPGGRGFIRFVKIDSIAFWWSSSASKSIHNAAWSLSMYCFYSGSSGGYNYYMTNLLSIRCVKD